ncbi:MAG: hypothetical protein ACR2NG_07530 [Acidimicrobiia bacterium]
MTSAPQPDDANKDLTLSERVAMANTWEEAVHSDEDSVIVELNVYPVESETTLPSTSFDTGTVGFFKRLFGSKKSTSQRSVPRRQV